MDRVYWLNPGESISAGDRTLTAVRPPLFDNPTTIGLYDDRSDAFFSADCFGALIPSSPVQSTDDIAEADLAQGMAGWASLDSPWAHIVKRDEFSQSMDIIRQLGPKRIFSAHLPPAVDKTDEFLKLLETVPSSQPSVAPNQEALEQILPGLK